MRAPVSMATLKRLVALEQACGQRKAVALFPKLIPIDERGAIADNLQAELKANIKKDCSPKYDEDDLSNLALVASE